MQRISIVIINHNYGRFLTSCIESCLSQSNYPHEIIVVDDGSTDNSAAIIRDFEDKIIAIMNHQQGHVASLNAGFAVSSGDICIFLDADDLLYSYCLNEIQKFWKGSASKLQYRLDTIDEEGQDQKMPFPHFSRGLTSIEIQRQAYKFGVYPWTVSTGNAYNRRYLEQLLPIDTISIYRSPDGYLNKLAPLYGEILSITNVLGAYRVHGQNAWAQDSKEIKIEPIIRWLNFEIVLHESFNSKASLLNIKLGPHEEIRSLQQIEYRFLAQRLAPKRSPYVYDTPLKLFFYGFKFLSKAPNVNLTGKVAWLLWIFFLTFVPLNVVKWLFLSGRGQIGRIRILREVVKRSRKSA